eukprot:gene46623-60039_t
MSPEGDDPIIVTGGKDSVIQVWNPTASAPQHVIKLPTSEVKALAVYQGSRTLIAIGTRDSKVLIWDVGDDKLIATFEGHRASVYCICITVTSYGSYLGSRPWKTCEEISTFSLHFQYRRHQSWDSTTVGF